MLVAADFGSGDLDNDFEMDLEDIKNATHFAENYTYDRGRYFLIRYRKDHTVVVESYDSIIVS
jgi:hypothetical protein